MPGIRSIPGTPGAMHQVGGLEHDEFGQPNFEPEQRAAMVRRRAERMEAIARAVSERMGEDEMHLGRHPVGILSWAATAGVVREACQSLSQQGWDLGFLLPRVVWPLPAARVREFLASGIERLFVCEANGSGQMASLLRACFGEALRQHGIEVVSIAKDDGEPFEAPEILEQLQKHLVDGHRVRKVI